MFAFRRVRPVRQSELSECGLACIAMIAQYHGSNVDLPGLRRDFAPSLKGLSLRSIIHIAEEIGFLAHAMRLPTESLRNLQLPAMLHWDGNHFVVLERIKRGKAEILDPALGRGSRISLAELERHFSGVALELRVADDLRIFPKSPRLRASQLWKNVTGWKRVAAQTLILTLILQVAALGWPFYMQIVVDKVIPSSDYSLLLLVALAFAVITILNAAAVVVRGFVLLSTGTSLGFVVTSRLGRKLFRLPVSWFERRHVGDVISRFQSVNPIQEAFTQGVISSLVDGVMAVLTLVLMLYYSAQLVAVTFASFAVYIMIRLISFGFERKAREAAIVAGGKEQSTLIETLRGITTLRLYGLEADRHLQWQDRLIDHANANVMIARIGIWQGAANMLLIGLEGVLIVWLGANIVLAGDMSLGMLIAYLAYKQQFLVAGTSLINQGIAFKMLNLHLDRISDIALQDEDISFAPAPMARQTFSGRLELNDISYRYAPSEPWVLKGLSFSINSGEHVAITGVSGGGKSTLAKIILGLDQAENGEILVDGIPLAKLGIRAYRSQVAGVLQEDTLFAGSVAKNIAMFDRDVDMDRVIDAARLAAVADEIEAMPMKYETLVGDMGSALSGGQKARVLLARALYRKPKLLLLDEGTAHLDRATEDAVNKAITSLGVTRIVIAHRRETIANADTVLVLENGALRPLPRADAAASN